MSLPHTRASKAISAWRHRKLDVVIGKREVAVSSIALPGALCGRRRATRQSRMLRGQTPLTPGCWASASASAANRSAGVTRISPARQAASGRLFEPTLESLTRCRVQVQRRRYPGERPFGALDGADQHERSHRQHRRCHPDCEYRPQPTVAQQVHPPCDQHQDAPRTRIRCRAPLALRAALFRFLPERGLNHPPFGGGGRGSGAAAQGRCVRYR